MTHTNADARAAANKLVALIRDKCERVEVAGSIRRGKAEVKDAELVVIPRGGLVRAGDVAPDRPRCNSCYCERQKRRGECPRRLHRVRGVLLSR